MSVLTGSPATTADAPTRRRGRHAGRRRYGVPRPQQLCIGLLGTIGAIAIVWLALSAVLGLRLVEFLTGSMAPGMPVGAVAVEHVVDAADIRIGDVVTVARSHDGKPVTHRVVAIAAGASPAERTLTLQGDANAAPDTETYPVTAAGRVLLVVPWLGTVLEAVKSPIGLGVTAIVVPLGVLWALWPARRREPARPDRSTRRASAE